MEFEASLDSLTKIMDYIRKEAELSGMESVLIHKMELACEEAVVNIISYAYKERTGQISVECLKERGRFEIILRDHGAPFNPIDVEVNPQFGTPIPERKVGGMGIYLIRKIIDEVSYQREGEENILRLVFNISNLL